MLRSKILATVPWRRLWLGANFALLLAGLRLQAASSPDAWMPRAEDFTLLWWANGPPRFHGMKSPPPDAVLCLQSGTLGLALDTKSLRLLHAGRFLRSQPAESAVRPDNRALFALPPVALELSVRQGGREFTCLGRGELPKDDFFFPVRFVESGRFLQRVAIEDLEFADAAGARFAGKGWLEIALWPDRAVLSFNVETTNQLTAGELAITAGGRRASQALRARQPVVLPLFEPEPAPPPVVESHEGELRLQHDARLGCAILELPRLKWQNAKGTYYPEEELDRLDRWRFAVRNDSGDTVTLPLLFVDAHPPAITGFTPLLGDADGTPTGIPVQISKNWHQRPEKGVLRHQGPWFHGASFVRLPPHSRRELTLAVAYARYGGVPAASHAQLSLIGWGHNQFWDQAAVGSFGESICYEPGRVQRRCAIDDIRPLMTLPDREAKPYGWAGNGGGGDFLMWIDEVGMYQGFRGTRCDYRAYGPCLTDVRYLEETRGGEMNSQVRVSIARSDDYLRAFHRFRYDVRQPVSWQRLAFYQLGADFYNETPARSVAVGDSGGLREEWQPVQAKDRFDRRHVELAGDQPWVSVHGVERNAIRPGGTLATRGLIVRAWKAVLGGKPCRQPHASFFATEWGRGNFRTTVELSPPPGVSELRPGDFVEAEVELVMLPADPPAYYGPNAAFRKALAQDAGTWRLVQREAAANALEVRLTAGKVASNYPLAVTVNPEGRAAGTLSGGIGYVPVTFRGLKDYRDFVLLVDGVPLNQAVHGGDFWQTDYDVPSQRWQITYNLPRDGRGPSPFEFRRRE